MEDRCSGWPKKTELWSEKPFSALKQIKNTLQNLGKDDHKEKTRPALEGTQQDEPPDQSQWLNDQVRVC